MLGTFLAIDLETANADLASICQVGVVTFTDGRIAETWQTLIDPEDEFDPINVSIHGIDAAKVVGAPRFVDVAPELAMLLADQVVVSHTAFDRVALSQARERHGIAAIPCNWLDSARVSRRAWPQFARRGFGLAQIARHCGIDFRHHDAAEDARAAGEILVRAMAETGLGIPGWMKRVNQPISGSGQASAKRIGNPDGELFGEVVVFTGALSMVRAEAADMAAAAGCTVGDSVGKTTTILVVGDTDIRVLAGHDRSSKQRKAETLIMAGQPIRILCERDFLAFLRVNPDPTDDSPPRPTHNAPRATVVHVGYDGLIRVGTDLAYDAPRPQRTARTIASQVHCVLNRREEERCLEEERLAREKHQESLRQGIAAKQPKPIERRRIEVPIVRPGPQGLCQNIDYLLLITEYDYDLSSPAFQAYCAARGTLSTAGVPGSTRWRFFADHSLSKADYLANPDFQFAQEFEGTRHRYSPEDMESLWKVTLLGRAALQDCWELFTETTGPTV